MSAQLMIVLADDDEDDRAMTEEALRANALTNPFHAVRDGEELMRYLHMKSDTRSPSLGPLSALILLDLNMPRKDGREALAEIRADAHLRHLPVIIFTTSKAQEDILRSYDLGASSVICKPVSYDDLVGVMGTVGKYWLETVDLPGDRSDRRARA